jgi:hypothetical protein
MQPVAMRQASLTAALARGSFLRSPRKPQDRGTFSSPRQSMIGPPQQVKGKSQALVEKVMISNFLSEFVKERLDQFLDDIEKDMRKSAECSSIVGKYNASLQLLFTFFANYNSSLFAKKSPSEKENPYRDLGREKCNHVDFDKLFLFLKVFGFYPIKFSKASLKYYYYYCQIEEAGLQFPEFRKLICIVGVKMIRSEIGNLVFDIQEKMKQKKYKSMIPELEAQLKGFEDMPIANQVPDSPVTTNLIYDS